MPRIQIIHHRDPDAGCIHTVFVDDREVEHFEVEDIDPGAGYEWETVDTRYTIAKKQRSVSPFRRKVWDTLVEARHAFERYGLGGGWTARDGDRGAWASVWRKLGLEK